MSFQLLVKPSRARRLGQYSRGKGPGIDRNELLFKIVQAADNHSWTLFTSDLVARELQLPLRYVQKKLSLFRKRRLLKAIKVPRWVRGGFRRGTLNNYSVTPRGRARANWWKRHNSLVGFTYLGRGVGDAREFGMLFASALIDEIVTDPRLFRVNSSTHAFSELLTYQNPIDLLPYSILDRKWRFLFSIQKLRRDGLIPPEIVRDMSFFYATAKGLGCEDEQIGAMLLKRSAVYWKRKCEDLERKNTTQCFNDELRKLESDIRISLIRLGALTQNPSPTHDSAVCDLKLQLQKMNWTAENSALTREVSKLRFQVMFNNYGMDMICSTIEPFWSTTPVVKYTSKMLREIQSLNRQCLWS